jgi:copper transporter 1
MDHSSHDHHHMDHSAHGGMDHGSGQCNMNVSSPSQLD